MSDVTAIALPQLYDSIYYLSREDIEGLPNQVLLAYCKAGAALGATRAPQSVGTVTVNGDVDQETVERVAGAFRMGLK